MKRLCVFDMDGTIMDTIRDVSDCFNEALDRCGYKKHSIGTYSNLIGGHLIDIVSNILPQESRTKNEIERVANLYREIYLSHPKPNTEPFDGINNLMHELINKGVLIAINTNKLQHLAEHIAKEHFSDIQFNCIQGYSTDFPGKPDPHGVNQIMRKTGVEACDTVYIGDTSVDIKTAENAGVDCILVTWGQGKDQDEKNPTVSFVAGSANDILNFVLN